MLSQTQPVNLKGANSSYNTITQTSSSTQNLAQTQLVNPPRVPSATRASQSRSQMNHQQKPKSKEGNREVYQTI